MKNRWRVFWLAAAGCLGALLLGSGAKLAAQTLKVDLSNAELIARGNELFAKSCSVGYCHGAEGRASRGPQLRERPWDPRRVYAITRDGVTGTTMPGWKEMYPAPDLWALTAYIMSLSSTPLKGEAAVIDTGIEAGAVIARSPEAQRGHDLFFDLTNQRRCGICHQLGAKGTAIGPDLEASAQRKSAEQLLRDIVEPSAMLAQGYALTEVATNNAERVTGVRKEETKEYVKLYDTTSAPPPLRTIYRDQIHALNSVKRSPMPADYARLYSADELKAIVAYLKSGNY
jgi:putative heme-binding domain-containing protein